MHVYSVMSDSATSWTIAHQAPLSMGFSRHEYWSGLPFPSSRDVPDPGIELVYLTSPAYTVAFIWCGHLIPPVFYCR